MSDEKTFSSLSFQSLVLSFLWKNQTSIQFSSLLKKEYFEDPRCAEVYQWIAYFIKTHGPPASKVMMRDILSKPQAIPTSLALFEVILKSTLTPPEESYVKSQVQDFCRFQAVLGVLANKAAPLMDRGDLSGLQTLLQESFSVGQGDFSTGLNYFKPAEINRRLRDRTVNDNRNFFSTWIADLDRFLRLRRGQIGVVIGNSGRGKTMFMIYMAKVLLMQKLKVVYYTLQLPEDEIAARMDAALANIFLRDLRDNPLKVSAGLKRFHQTFQSNFFIKGFPTRTLTVSMLRDHIDMLRTVGFHPDVILVDYGNLMVTEDQKRRDNSRYSELGEIYEDMMALSQKQEIFSLIAHQSKQTSWDKPLLTIADAADSSQAVMVSPLVITLNRNLQDEVLEQARIYVPKNTYGPDGKLVTIRTGFDRGLYHVPWKKVRDGGVAPISTSDVVTPTSTLKKGRKYVHKAGPRSV